MAAAASILHRAAASSRSLSHLLTAPSKIANSLDWKKASGCVLSLRVNRDFIDLAVASHPSFDEPAQPLAAIPLALRVERNRTVVASSVAEALQLVVHNYNVCGLVVSWPVQAEGWCGASCGRVLHALDQIRLDAPRPVCLYDPGHRAPPPEDEWGRAEIYSQTSDQTVHVASEEQYQDCTGKVAAQVWDEFMREHWPELCGPVNNERDSHHKKPAASAAAAAHEPSWLEDRAYAF